MQCSMAWALHRTEKEKPAAGKTDYWRDFWRSGWDSNPRNLAVQLISSQSRYDHFDTAPYLSQHQHLGKRGELMGRTSKNIKLRIPEKPHKIKGFRSGSYRVATTISSIGFENHTNGFEYMSQMECLRLGVGKAVSRSVPMYHREYQKTPVIGRLRMYCIPLFPV